jgi:hypothetical protein
MIITLSYILCSYLLLECIFYCRMEHIVPALQLNVTLKEKKKRLKESDVP